MGKQKHSKDKSLCIFCVELKSIQFPKHGIIESRITEQVWENTDNFHVLLYLTDLGLMKTHAITSVWDVQFPTTSKYYMKSHVIPRH